jgi:hypothetical protein
VKEVCPSSARDDGSSLPSLTCVAQVFAEVARTYVNYRELKKRPGKACWDTACLRELGLTTKKVEP